MKQTLHSRACDRLIGAGFVVFNAFICRANSRFSMGEHIARCDADDYCQKPASITRGPEDSVSP